MPQHSHDHNFKNVFLDFPRESLELFYPQALELYGELQEISFVRQEPRKHHLSDSGLALDMPILFRFTRGALVLWLVEFQEDKGKFSIYKLLRYLIVEKVLILQSVQKPQVQEAKKVQGRSVFIHT
ncbi:hypothetical protein [Desulfonatronum thioautotrophicum]|uniref:hypothetical protein n=1 Tax=Desulfonatronum thioautotrophicum TaxID=617001 RepID=UPI0005EB272F|nr:hypothetical protein [Desulfonatronum thioautotrophicum]